MDHHDCLSHGGLSYVTDLGDAMDCFCFHAKIHSDINVIITQKVLANGCLVAFRLLSDRRASVLAGTRQIEEHTRGPILKYKYQASTPPFHSNLLYSHKLQKLTSFTFNDYVHHHRCPFLQGSGLTSSTAHDTI